LACVLLLQGKAREVVSGLGGGRIAGRSLAAAILALELGCGNFEVAGKLGERALGTEPGHAVAMIGTVTSGALSREAGNCPERLRVHEYDLRFCR
jgi:hypothetical protein